MTQTARVARPEELLTLLPYLLGYHPTHSLVVVGLVGGRRLGPVERIDLLVRGESYPADVAGALAGPLLADGADAALVVAFGGAPASRSRALTEVTEALVADGVEVVDRLTVADGRWWSVDCRDAVCCPPGGRPLPAPHDVPAVAEFVWRGVAPYSDRAALVDHWSPRGRGTTAEVTSHAPCEPVTGNGDSPHSEALPAAGPGLTEAITAWEAVLNVQLRCGVQQVEVNAGVIAAATADRERTATADRQRAVAVAADPQLRDEVLARLCPGLLPIDERRDPRDASARGQQPPLRANGDEQTLVSRGPRSIEDVSAVLDTMAELARWAPGRARYDVLAMAATVAWWHGDGTAARICAEEVVRGAPDHSLGRMLCELMDAGVRPGGCR